MNKTKFHLKNYSHLLPLLIFFLIYMIWFEYLERTVTSNYHIIHLSIDDHIPFLEIFVIPYFLWYAYVAVVLIYLFFTHKENYYRMFLFLATGMTLFLIISTLWPNGHHLRPNTMARDNLFTDLIRFLYSIDTSTNLWPSIHVFNSLSAHIAVINDSKLCKNKLVHIGSLTLCALIILSTVFIKQHSVFDMLTAFLFASVLYLIIYKLDIINACKSYKLTHTKKPQVS